MMDVAFLFPFGLIATILEVHLYDYGFDSFEVAMVFVLESVLYLFFSMIAGIYLKNANERLCMVIGVLSLSLGYTMLAPWTIIFPNEVWVIIMSIPFISFGQCFCYSNFYIVFSIPYMQKCAIKEYGYFKDDILDEHICSYSVTAYTIGEILGPIYAGSFIDKWSIEERCVFIAAVSVVFSIVYMLGTEMVCDAFRKKSIKVQSTNDLKVSITD
jgi:MFS family permease